MEDLNDLLAHIYQAEADTVKAEANIISKVEMMLETIANLIQLINPMEEHYTSVNDMNSADSVKLNLVKKRVINEDVIGNLNSMADSLAKVLRSLSDLIGESLDALGDCKEARGKLLLSLGEIVEKRK